MIRCAHSGQRLVREIDPSGLWGDDISCVSSIASFLPPLSLYLHSSWVGWNGYNACVNAYIIPKSNNADHSIPFHDCRGDCLPPFQQNCWKQSFHEVSLLQKFIFCCKRQLSHHLQHPYNCRIAIELIFDLS